MLTRKDMNKLVSLLYLLSVSQNASKRKASEKLDTSIDTINKYLGDLEQDLGSKLLASNGRGTQTTPEALEILPLGQTLKSILREVEFLATKNSEISGVVRLSVEDGVTSTLFNGKFLDVFRRYPGLQIQTENGNGLSGLSLLDYDIAMSYTPPSGSDMRLPLILKNSACLMIWTTCLITIAFANRFTAAVKLKAGKNCAKTSNILLIPPIRLIPFTI